MKRPCLEPGCAALTTATRCPMHTKQHEQRRWAAKQGRYNGQWRKQSKQSIADHLAEHGPLCPGWATAAHIVDPSILVTDHDVGVLCRPCNSRKAATFDKARRSD